MDRLHWPVQQDFFMSRVPYNITYDRSTRGAECDREVWFRISRFLLASIMHDMPRDHRRKFGGVIILTLTLGEASETSQLASYFYFVRTFELLA